MNKKHVVFKIFIIYLILLTSLTGCMHRDKNNEIVIGVAWPFELKDNLFNEGVDLAVREINGSGGINGRKIRLIKKDDKSEVATGMYIAQYFAENKEVQAVIGHYNSFVSIPASTIYDNAGLVMFSPSSTAPSLTQNGYRHVFRGIPSDDEIARQLALYLSKQGYKRMVNYYTDDSYGNGLANSFEDNAKLNGISIVDRFNYYTSLEDLKRLYKRWQAFGVDGVFISASVAEGGEFILDAGKAGIELPFVAGNSLDSPELYEIAGEAAEGLIVGSAFNPNDDRPEVDRFVKDFAAEYNVMPSSYAALGYDAVKILAAAIKESDLDDHSTIAEELRNLGKWTGVVGTHEFNENGDDIGDLVVLKKLQNGIFDYIKR